MKNPLLYSFLFKGVGFRLDFPGFKILYFIHFFGKEYDFVRISLRLKIRYSILFFSKEYGFVWTLRGVNMVMSLRCCMKWCIVLIFVFPNVLIGLLDVLC